MTVLIWIAIGFLAGVTSTISLGLFLAKGDDYEPVSVVDESCTSGRIWL